jgi:hypothetical protein
VFWHIGGYSYKPLLNEVLLALVVAICQQYGAMQQMKQHQAPSAELQTLTQVIHRLMQMKKLLLWTNRARANPGLQQVHVGNLG